MYYVYIYVCLYALECMCVYQYPNFIIYSSSTIVSFFSISILKLFLVLFLLSKYEWANLMFFSLIILDFQIIELWPSVELATITMWKSCNQSFFVFISLWENFVSVFLQSFQFPFLNTKTFCILFHAVTLVFFSLRENVIYWSRLLLNPTWGDGGCELTKGDTISNIQS